jgi:hypothetical protein
LAEKKVSATVCVCGCECVKYLFSIIEIEKENFVFGIYEKFTFLTPDLLHVLLLWGFSCSLLVSEIEPFTAPASWGIWSGKKTQQR